MALHPISEPIPPDLALDEAPFSGEELDEYLAAQEDGESPSHHERFHSWRIDDDGAAEWAMRNLVERRHRIDELARRRDDWMEKIDHWFRQASREDQRSAEFFEGALADYMRRRREADADTKSIPLPSGRLTSTGTGGKPTVADNDTVVAWIRGHVDLDEYRAIVKDEPTVRIRDLRKRLRVDRQQVGVEIDATLACDHRIVEVWRFDEHDGEEFAAPPSTMPCPECPEDPLDGTPPIVKVSVVGTAPAFEEVVLHDDLDLPVPGLAVEPAGFNVDVKPDA